MRADRITEFEFEARTGVHSKSHFDRFYPWLRYMVNPECTLPPPVKLPDHPLFSAYGWEWAFVDSMKYRGRPAGNRLHLVMGADGTYYCNVRVDCAGKNLYREFDLFIDWVSPFFELITVCRKKNYEKAYFRC